MTFTLNELEYTYENDAIKNQFERIDLKQKLNRLESTFNKLKLASTNDYKKREESHQERLELFKKRVKFFDRYLNRTSKTTEAALQTTNECRIEIAQMQKDKERLLIELDELKRRKESIQTKLNRFDRHNRIWLEAQNMMKTNIEVSKPGELIKRYESLELSYVEFENQIRMKENIESRESFVEKLIELFQRMVEAEANLKEARNQAERAAIDLEASKKVFIDREIEKSRVVDSINYMNDLLITNNFVSRQNGRFSLIYKLNCIQKGFLEIKRLLNKNKKTVCFKF